MKKLNNYGVGLIMTVAVLLLLDVGVGVILDLFARDRFLGMWLEAKTSKAELLRNAPVRPDFVLVGSSRTEFHFDTEAMSISGFRFFNFGAPGLEFEDLIYPVIRSAEYARMGIILNVPVDFLALPLSCPKWPTGEEVAFLRARLRKECKATPFAARTLLAVRNWYRPALQFAIHRTKLEQALREQRALSARPGHERSRGLNYVRWFPHGGFIVTYRNGDAEMVTDGARTPIVFAEAPKPVGRLHPERLALLRALDAYVTSKGLRLIVNIERPSIMHATDFSSGIPALDGLSYMVTADIQYPHDMWADALHLNGRGVARYDAQFLERLKRLLGRLSENQVKRQIPASPIAPN